jgi:hypothetical protein
MGMQSLATSQVFGNSDRFMNYEVIIDSVPTMGYQPNRCWVKNWKQIIGLRGQITVANK